MANIGTDSFVGISTGEELATFNVAWTKHTSYTNNLVGALSYSDAITVDSAASISLYYHSGTPSSADYTVDVTGLFSGTTTGLGQYAAAGRISTSANTFYMGRLSANGLLASTCNWQIFRAVSGSFAQLGSSSSVSITADVEYNVRLKMDGSSISLYGDGAGSPTIGPITDSNITSAGKAGVRIGRPTAGGNPFVTAFSADDLGAAAASMPPARSARRFAHMMVR